MYAYQSKQCRSCIHRSNITYGSTVSDENSTSSLFCAYILDTGKSRTHNVSGTPGVDCGAYEKGSPLSRRAKANIPRKEEQKRADPMPAYLATSIRKQKRYHLRRSDE